MQVVDRKINAPRPSTSFITEPKLDYLGIFPVLRFDYYRDDKNREPVKSGLVFKEIMSVKKTAYFYCSVWHLEAYDVLVEVLNSDWIKEINNSLDSNRKMSESIDFKKFHHYMIFFESFGCLEVIAKEFELLKEEPGSWPQ